MDVTPLQIAGAWVFGPQQHLDTRGRFLEWLRQDELTETVGRAFHVEQANESTSSAGVVRGIHFAQLPPGQAKYVTCIRGVVFDVVVDLRVGSPTFGDWQAIRLDEVRRRAVFISEGLGHGFMALTEGATVAYLCSTPYTPAREHGIHPFDPALAIAWPTTDGNDRPLSPTLSPKDDAQPSLETLTAGGVLSTIDEAQAFYELGNLR